VGQECIEFLWLVGIPTVATVGSDDEDEDEDEEEEEEAEEDSRSKGKEKLAKWTTHAHFWWSLTFVSILILSFSLGHFLF